MMKSYLVILIAISAGVSVSFLAEPALSAIPPTSAFSSIGSAGQWINATSYSDSVEIETQGDLTMSISGDTITIKLKEKTCGLGLSVVGIDSDGLLVCAIP